MRIVKLYVNIENHISEIGVLADVKALVIEAFKDQAEAWIVGFDIKEARRKMGYFRRGAMKLKPYYGHDGLRIMAL